MNAWFDAQMNNLWGMSGNTGHLGSLGASSLHDLMDALLVIHIRGITITGGRSFVVRPHRLEFDENEIIFCFDEDPLFADIDMHEWDLKDEFEKMAHGDTLCIKSIHHHYKLGWLASYQVAGKGGGDIVKSLNVRIVFRR